MPYNDLSLWCSHNEGHANPNLTWDFYGQASGGEAQFHRNSNGGWGQPGPAGTSSVIPSREAAEQEAATQEAELIRRESPVPADLVETLLLSPMKLALASGCSLCQDQPIIFLF